MGNKLKKNGKLLAGLLAPTIFYNILQTEYYAPKVCCRSKVLHLTGNTADIEVLKILNKILITKKKTFKLNACIFS